MFFVQAMYKERIESTYGANRCTHPTNDTNAYLYAVGATNRGRCYDLCSMISGALSLPGYQTSRHGSSRGSGLSHSTIGDQSSQNPSASYNDALHRRLDALEEGEPEWDAREEEHERQIKKRCAKIQRQIE